MVTKKTDCTPIRTALVFLEAKGKNSEPYTTSEIIASGTTMTHRRVRDAIRKYQTEFEAFGKVGAYQTTLQSGQSVPGYILNEQQAAFLLTLLKNTPVVVAFKKELVRQFYVMREELARRRELRAEGKPIRRNLTDALRDSGENERMHGHAYGAYTDLAYRLATGKSAAQLRRERGASKTAVAADFLTSEELAAYQKQEAALATLIDAGLCYQQIKTVLLERPELQANRE